MGNGTYRYTIAAYDDKGNTSTNVQMNPAGVTGVVISPNPWAAAPSGLPTITVNGTLNPFTTTNGTASAAQTFTASGSFRANTSAASSHPPGPPQEKPSTASRQPSSR